MANHNALNGIEIGFIQGKKMHRSKMPVHFALAGVFELPEKFGKSFFSVLSTKVSTSLLYKQIFATKKFTSRCEMLKTMFIMSQLRCLFVVIRMDFVYHN